MKKIGIIGGLGPSATHDLYGLIIQHTPAQKDQEHLRVIIDSHPQIPDRTAALLHNGPSPIPQLTESLDLLEKAGAQIIGCPCNTAHIFLRQIKEQRDFPLVDMIEETIKTLTAKGITKAGLLSTSATAALGIYQQTGQQHGVTITTPDEEGIKKSMQAIYGEQGIKAGAKYEKSAENKQLFLDSIKQFQEQGINHIIMGCTEIPLCLETTDTTAQLINPTEILAKALIKAATN